MLWIKLKGSPVIGGSSTVSAALGIGSVIKYEHKQADVNVSFTNTIVRLSQKSVGCVAGGTIMSFKFRSRVMVFWSYISNIQLE